MTDDDSVDRRSSDPSRGRRFARDIFLWAVTLLLFIRALVSVDNVAARAALGVGLAGVVAGGALIVFVFVARAKGEERRVAVVTGTGSAASRQWGRGPWREGEAASHRCAHTRSWHPDRRGTRAQRCGDPGQPVRHSTGGCSRPPDLGIVASQARPQIRLVQCSIRADPDRS
jgi:hypothetical protein